MYPAAWYPNLCRPIGLFEHVTKVSDFILLKIADKVAFMYRESGAHSLHHWKEQKLLCSLRADFMWFWLIMHENIQMSSKIITFLLSESFAWKEVLQM